jgi:DNA-binding response OmpR family regulator
MLEDDDWIVEMNTLVIFEVYPQAEIVRYANGDEAWRELSQRDPDLFIFDEYHPGVQGSEIVRRLADRKAKFPMIFLTGLAEPAGKEFGAASAGFGIEVKVLRKPIKADELLRTIKCLLETPAETTERKTATEAMNAGEPANGQIHAKAALCARPSEILADHGKHQTTVNQSVEPPAEIIGIQHRTEEGFENPVCPRTFLQSASVHNSDPAYKFQPLTVIEMDQYQKWVKTWQEMEFVYDGMPDKDELIRKNRLYSLCLLRMACLFRNERKNHAADLHAAITGLLRAGRLDEAAFLLGPVV